MARIVILSFDDNKVAESFVRQAVEDGNLWQLPKSGEAEKGRWVECKVEVVLARPTRWCHCAVPESRGRRRGKRERGWSRSAHFGWWVCVHCGRPSMAVVHHFISGLLNGANDMLPEILGIGKPLTPHEHWLRNGGLDYVEAMKQHNTPQQTEF